MIQTILTGLHHSNLGTTRLALRLNVAWKDMREQFSETPKRAPTDIGLEDVIIHGTPVQAELTSQQVSELQESVTLLQKEKSYLVSKVESVQMKVKGECNEEIDSLQSKIKELQSKVHQLTLNEDSFRDNNQKVLYYTGLTNWELLNVLFQYVKDDLKKCSILTPFQQLLSTLMRLRLDLSGQDLAYRIVLPLVEHLGMSWKCCCEIKAFDCLARSRHTSKDYAYGFPFEFF